MNYLFWKTFWTVVPIETFTPYLHSQCFDFVFADSKKSCSTKWGSDYGEVVTCDGSDAAIGICASGGDRDCKNAETDYNNAITCCDGKQYYQLITLTGLI